MKGRLTRLQALALALGAGIGLLASTVLWLREAGELAHSRWLSALCGASATSGCELAAASPLAHPFGLSLALVGVAYFGALLVVTSGAWLHGAPFLAGLCGLAALGLAADAALCSYSLFALGAVCTLCALAWCATLAVTLVSFRVWLGAERGSSLPRAERRPACAFLGLGLLAVVSGTGWLQARFAPLASASFVADPDRALRLAWDAFHAYYRAQEPCSLATENAPRKGAAHPVLEFVLFADFACPHCRTASGLLDEFVERHRDTTALVFKHYPLDDECNPQAERVHPGACRLARAAVSAGAQGQFWRMRDALFAQLELWTRGVSGPQLVALASEHDLDAQAFERALDSESTRSVVASDLAEAERLGVLGTPTLFLNGRRMPSIPIPTFLEELLRIEGAERAGFGAPLQLERGASQ